MFDRNQYRFIDNTADRPTGICITPDGWDDGRACIELDGDDIAFLPASERQRAAQALAGDGYRVVSAQEWKIAYDAGFEAGKKYAQQSQPGTSDRGHAVFQFDATCPICAKAEVQAAQSDRPAPVDPSEIAKAKAEALREAAAIWYSDDGPEQGSAVTWLYSRANKLDPPEPDPAAVEALAEILDSDPLSVAGTTDDVRKMARRLIRRGVHVEVPDA